VPELPETFVQPPKVPGEAEFATVQVRVTLPLASRATVNVFPVGSEVVVTV
jgi:hypothetical protein